MSLPEPDYLTNELSNRFDGVERLSVVVEDTGSFDKQILEWKRFDKFSQQILHDLIMAYAAVNGVSEANALPLSATAPFYMINMGGKLESGDLDTPAYHTDVKRTATFITDDENTETVEIESTGSDPVTYDDVINAIESQTSVTLTHIDDSDNPWHQNLYLQGGTADHTGTLTIEDGNLFRDLILFNGFQKFAGVDDSADSKANEDGGLRGALELNIRANRPYSEQFKYVQIQDGPPVGSSKTEANIFYNNDDGEWQRVFDRSTV